MREDLAQLRRNRLICMSLPPRAANSRATSAFSRSRRAARGGSLPSLHLQDQDCDTPNARQLTAAGSRGPPSGRR